VFKICFKTNHDQFHQSTPLLIFFLLKTAV